MGWFFSVLLIAAGCVAAASFIVSKLPDARKALDILTPLSGWIGVVLLAIGLIYTFKYVLPGFSQHFASLGGFLALASVVDALLLGFLLGFALISRLTGGKSATALAKGELLRARLAPMQVPLGIAGIALGIWALV